MIHQLTDIQSKNIGKNTNIWQFCVILKDAVIGENCNINCQVFIENDVIIGNNVTIKPGVQIWDGITIEDNVLIGPNVTFTNDLRPRSKNSNFKIERTLVRKGASIGANSSILCGIIVGKFSMIGLGSVVTKNVPDFALVYGNPAKIMGWVDQNGEKLKMIEDNIYQSTNGQKYICISNNLIEI